MPAGSPLLPLRAITLFIFVLSTFSFLCGPNRSALAASETAFHVAPNGNDAWSGKLAAPNAANTDGPFATLRRARDAIRQLKKQHGLPDGGVDVILGGGLYQPKEPLELTAEDSGAQKAPIVYRAADGQQARLLGGRLVTGFEPVTAPDVVKRLDEAARKHIVRVDLRKLGVTEFGQAGGGGLELFFQDRPMTLARWPNEGFIHITDLVGGQPVDVRGTKGDKLGKFMFADERPTRWAAEPDAWVHGYWFWDWSDQRHPVESIDAEKRILAVKPPYHNYGYRKGQWFYGFNLLCELDRPGEWYLDRQAGVLYFWPPGPVDSAQTIVSVMNTMFTLRDASHVTLRGLSIEACRGTPVTISGGRECLVAGCILRNHGASAVSVSGGRAHGVVGCDVYGMAGGGVSLSGGDRRTLTPAGHYAVNNHIHHYGRWYRMYRAAVSLNGVGNRAAHNLIHHAPHQAISFGGNDHLLELNEMHHVCEESNDAGAIYSGRDWTMRGTVVRHNFMHHVTGFRDRGCVGVYLDDMFSGVEISGNVFYKVTRAAFIGGGRDCTVVNNLFVDCNPALHIDARALGWAAYSVPTTMMKRLEAMPYKTPPWSERYPRLVDILDGKPAAPEGNLVTRNVCVGGRWDGVHGVARPYVAFKDNLVDLEDPKFVDRDKMDFRLAEDSPVCRKLPGFKKIPFEKIGLIVDEYRRTLPGKSGQ